MFFKKKDEKGTLPELPPLPLEDFALRKPQKVETKEFDTGFGKQISGISGNVKFNEKMDDGLSGDELHEDVLMEKHALPSFPDSPMNKGFSQSAIKDAVSESELKDLPELPEVVDEKKEVKLKEMDEDGFRTMETASMYKPAGMMEIPKRQESFVSVEKHEKNQDIFVKLDKFKAGKKSVQEAKARLQEVENLLKRIRETKMREEQELAGWENEINFVKTKLKDVTDNIFEKVE